MRMGSLISLAPLKVFPYCHLGVFFLVTVAMACLSGTNRDKQGQTDNYNLYTFSYIFQNNFLFFFIRKAAF